MFWRFKVLAWVECRLTGIETACRGLRGAVAAHALANGLIAVVAAWRGGRGLI